MQFYDPKTSLAGERRVIVALTGTGAAAPTKRFGQSVTVTRTGVGVFRLTFKEKIGTFVGLEDVGFGSDTMSATKGYSATHGAFDATNRTLDVSVWDASNAAVELAALQYLTFAVIFASTKAAG